MADSSGSMLALFAALALFWLSTRQFAFAWRLLTWAAGAALLGWAAFGQTYQSDQFGLWRALQEAWTADRIVDSALLQALRKNAKTVAQFVPQLLDFFLLAGAAMAALAALAFTRGERLERTLRPVILMLVAFVAGSTATLAVVAIGLGGQVRPQTYTGLVAQEGAVYDGDTFTLGDISLRLWGIDAPELHQECRNSEAVIEPCGEAARDQLQSTIRGHLLQCDRDQSLESGQTEAFGRPLVRCRRIGVGATTDIADIGGEMIRTGYAIPYRNNPAYDYDDEKREGDSRGVMALCSLWPHSWRARAARDVRIAFENGAIPTAEFAMGRCPPVAATPPQAGQQ